MQDKNMEIYTDGSCLGNPGPGGWGTIILYKDEELKLSGGEPQTTNNRMEMTAILRALEWVHTESGLSEQELTAEKIKIYSDSSLIIKTLTDGWKRKANLDLWSEMDRLRAWLDIEWIWVKGHADNKYNNLADELAVTESTRIKKGQA